MEETRLPHGSHEEEEGRERKKKEGGRKGDEPVEID